MMCVMGLSEQEWFGCVGEQCVWDCLGMSEGCEENTVTKLYKFS